MNATVGAMGVAIDSGLRIPEDIAFTGYDGSQLSESFRPQLTTIRLDYAAMAHKLVEFMERSFSGEKSTEIALISPCLEIRESSRRN